MNIHITFKNLDSSDAIKNHINEKTEKLLKYFNGNISVDWVLSVEKQAHVAHCHMVGNNMDYFGEGTSNDLYASIEMALERIEKQLRKHKEIVKDHLHKHGHRLPKASGE